MKSDFQDSDSPDINVPDSELPAVWTPDDVTVVPTDENLPEEEHKAIVVGLLVREPPGF